MVVNLLREEDIPARSDATAAMPVFGGLPSSLATSSSFPRPRRGSPARFSSQYPHFKNLKNVHEPEL